jgi:hypothetical protein
MKLTQKQIESVLLLPGPKRYENFIKVAADQRCVWGLFQEGWALSATNDGEPVFPVWPASEYASLCASGVWSRYEPKRINLDDFFNGLIPSLHERKTKLGVFYTPNDKGVIPELEQVEADLKAELSRIE